MTRGNPFLRRVMTIKAHVFGDKRSRLRQCDDRMWQKKGIKEFETWDAELQ